MAWEDEDMARGQEGLVIFDGGSYTSGPISLGAQVAAAASHAAGWLSRSLADRGLHGVCCMHPTSQEYTRTWQGQGKASTCCIWGPPMLHLTQTLPVFTAIQESVWVWPALCGCGLSRLEVACLLCCASAYSLPWAAGQLLE